MDTASLETSPDKEAVSHGKHTALLIKPAVYHCEAPVCLGRLAWRNFLKQMVKSVISWFAILSSWARLFWGKHLSNVDTDTINLVACPWELNPDEITWVTRNVATPQTQMEKPKWSQQQPPENNFEAFYSPCILKNLIGNIRQIFWHRWCSLLKTIWIKKDSKPF